MVLCIRNFKRGINDNFAINFIPSLLAIRMNEIYRTKNTKRMDAYLKQMYGIDTRYIIAFASHHIKTSWFGNICQIGIDINIYEPRSEQKIESLIKLIDSGNTDVKGLNIFREALMYINAYLNQAFKMYVQLNTVSKKKEK